MINLREEINYFFNGLVFFTRIPGPNSIDYNDNNLNLARTYFPLIGLIIGVSSALILYLFQLFMPITASILIAMSFSIFITGAFHEDGLADCFDGFGGGYGKTQIMTIMKDSRVGTYAVVGLIMTLALKFSLLYALSGISLTIVLFVLITAHTISRLMASIVVSYSQYVQDIDQSKSKPIATERLSIQRQICAALLAVIPTLLLIPISLIVKIVLFTTIIQYLMVRYFTKHIGGYTGDCLGAVQQVTEIACYVIVVIAIGNVG